MYKDKDRQREANKRAKERWKAKQADIYVREALGIPEKGIPERGIPPIERIPKKFPKRGKDIKVFEDLLPDVQDTINRMSLVDGKIDQTIKAKRTTAAVKYQHLFPGSYEPQHAVSIATRSGVVTGKPGDADCNGICTEEWIRERKGAAS